MLPCWLRSPRSLLPPPAGVEEAAAAAEAEAEAEAEGAAAVGVEEAERAVQAAKGLGLDSLEE